MKSIETWLACEPLADANKEAWLRDVIADQKPPKPEMSDEELANKLLCVLSQEMIRKADLFDYLCWLEEKEQRERVPDALFLVMASDGRTCWGKSYAAAVADSMKYDEKPYGDFQKGEAGE